MFYGYQIGMTRQEVMDTRYGEMLDMISCLSVYNGAAKVKNKRVLSYDDAINLR